MKKKIYFWASDISNNSGEGILANSFIKNYKKNNSVKFINISNNDIYQKKIILENLKVDMTQYIINIFTLLKEFINYGFII